MTQKGGKNVCTCMRTLRCKVHPTKAEFGLWYITQSPPAENGGFNSQTVAVAKSALRLIKKLRRGATD